MKITVLFFALIILATGCLAQVPTNSSGEELTQMLPGMLIPADLSKSLDAKKAKVGDKIELKTSMDMISHGQIVIPRGSKIEAHVTSAKPHTKDSPDSELGIAFDRIFITNGKELPMQASIQAIAPPIIVNNNPFGAPAGVGPQPPPGQGSKNVGTSDAPVAVLSSAQQMPSMSGSNGTSTSNAGDSLTSGSHGAVGMKNVTLTGAKEDNKITSSTQNVHLDGSTQFMLKVE